MDNTQEIEVTPVAAEEGTTEKLENPRLYPRWMVRHVEINRKERHRLAKVARTQSQKQEDRIQARGKLKKVIPNHPVRKVFIDDRLVYIVEPYYQDGMSVFRKTATAELAALGEEKPSKQKLHEIYVKASRAFVARLTELVTPKSPEPANV